MYDPMNQLAVSSLCLDDRAKFVTGSVALLQSKPDGGVAWLRALRDVSYADAAEALCTLPGVGPKVRRVFLE